MALFVFGLVSAAALSFTGVAGPEPRDLTTNKPSAQACAAARAAGRTLPGCEPAEAEVDEAREEASRPEGRPGLFICPGDPRCPPR